MEYAQLVRRLTPETHYVTNEKEMVATLTEDGIAYIEQALGVDNLYAPLEGNRQMSRSVEHKPFRLDSVDGRKMAEGGWARLATYRDAPPGSGRGPAGPR